MDITFYRYSIQLFVIIIQQLSYIDVHLSEYSRKAFQQIAELLPTITKLLCRLLGIAFSHLPDLPLSSFFYSKVICCSKYFFISSFIASVASSVVAMRIKESSASLSGLVYPLKITSLIAE